MYRDFPFPDAAPAPPRARVVAAALLRALGAALDALARRLATHEPAPARATPPSIEFHAEAGAPEGALFVDGRLVGHLEGVNRL